MTQSSRRSLPTRRWLSLLGSWNSSLASIVLCSTKFQALSSPRNVIEVTQHAIDLDLAAAHCGECELSSNLWLCLTCGHLACGRKNYDGTGGNGHALEHHEKTGHTMVVKTGTVTAEGNACSVLIIFLALILS